MYLPSFEENWCPEYLSRDPTKLILLLPQFVSQEMKIFLAICKNCAVTAVAAVADGWEVGKKRNSNESIIFRQPHFSITSSAKTSHCSANLLTN